MLLGESTGWAKDVVLVDGGTARCAIYATPQAMTGGVVTASVQDLSHYLEVMSGAKVPVFTNPPPKRGDDIAILVGERAVERFGRPKETSRFGQAWRLVANKKGVGLVGESDESTSYAVYELLDQLGCRWFMPSDMGEVIPAAKTVALKEQDVSAVPATIYRNIWYADQDFKRRNRLGGFYLACSHAIPGDVCRADPAVAKKIADDTIAELDKKYVSSVSLSPADTINFCQCEKCKALDAGDWDTSMNCMSLSDRMVHFGNAIVGEVTKKYPNVMFGMLAYVQYTRPPLKEKPLPNLVPQIAPITYCRAHSMLNTNCPSRRTLKPIVEGWGKVAQNVSMYHYGYNLAEVSCPYPMMTLWSEELPVCHQNHMTFWMPETMPNFESTIPGLYMGLRLSWYTTARPADILDEFFNRFYGSAAEPMRAYWQGIDDAWTKVEEHAGCGFGHMKRFTPEVMKAARSALDKATAACKTDMEKRRVKIVDESFREFELFMKMRRDLVEGRLAALENDGTAWIAEWDRLMDAYKAQSAFSPYAKGYFQEFFFAPYKDGARIAKDYVVLSPLREWRYAVDKEKKGESLGWAKPELDDKAWKVTDPGVDSWASLGLDYGYYGGMWYRTAANLSAVPAGKKIFLWISATDGSAKVFVNGQHVPYVDDKGQNKDMFSGYCAPGSFDITTAAKAGATNSISILGTHDYINELGTGGLLGPVLVYHEK